MKKSAVQKRDTARAPEVQRLTQAKSAHFPVGKMLISSPLEISSVVQAIPRGKMLTLSGLRHHLAKRHRADYTCPLTTGIFLRIVAEAAEEERGAGKKSIPPYWRVVRDDGKLLDKLPGGVAAQAKRLEEEQHEVLWRGKTARVELDRRSWLP